MSFKNNMTSVTYTSLLPLALFCILFFAVPNDFAAAQEMKKDRSDRSGRDDGRPRHHGIGIGLGIGLGIAGNLLEQQNANKRDIETKKKHTKKKEGDHRVAKKKGDDDDGKKQGKPDGGTTSQNDDKPGDPVTLQTTDGGHQDGSIPPEKMTNCCSCVDSLKLILKVNGPFEVPPQLKKVRNPENQDEEPTNEAFTPKKPKGHGFDVEVKYHTKKNPVQENMKLQWLEKASRWYWPIDKTGAKDNEEVDVQSIFTTSEVKIRPRRNDGKPADLITIADYVKKSSGTATAWLDYEADPANHCEAKDVPGTVFIHDKPSAYSPRRLDFHIIVTSGKSCKCPKEKLELFATQVVGKFQDADMHTDTWLYGPDGALTLTSDPKAKTIEGKVSALQPKETSPHSK